MSGTHTIDLDRLPALTELFALFNAGRQLNRLRDIALWSELERERASYMLLFERMGYTLRIDERGFAWFHFEDGSSSLSKASRQIALFCLLLFEHQADSGRQLARFTEWRIDRSLLAVLVDSHAQLLEAEALAEVESLAGILKTASAYGFAEVDGHGWRLLPAVHRYLDIFEELVARDDPLPGDNDEAGESP